MSYTTAEGRRQILDELAGAIDEIAAALAGLGSAYELLDEQTADALEAALYRPVQTAYGRAKATHTAFAQRSGLPVRRFAEVADPGAPSTGAIAFVQDAAEAAQEADQLLADLQDGMLPVEVGDAELRAALADVRSHLGRVEPAARTFLRSVGR